MNRNGVNKAEVSTTNKDSLQTRVLCVCVAHEAGVQTLLDVQTFQGQEGPSIRITLPGTEAFRLRGLTVSPAADQRPVPEQKGQLKPS